jgi:lipopolysaccharide heptosyltransferase II
LFRKLKKENFELVVDLRNSLLEWLLPAKYKTSPFLAIPGDIRHMQKRHLFRLAKAIEKYGRLRQAFERKFLLSSQKDEAYIDSLLKQGGIAKEDTLVVIAPGARSHIKRWSEDKFLELSAALTKEFQAKIILVADRDDIPIAKYISEHSPFALLDLAGRTTLVQLACLLRRVKCVVTNDSAVLHLASYLNLPTVAIFGPTNEAKYGPWSELSAVAKKEITCRPCEKAQCRFGTLACLHFVRAEDVLRQVRNILAPSSRLQATGYRDDFKRILIVRTDRIGDVLLSTPVIENLRQVYPHAYIAVLVSPYTKEIVEANPYLDEVIIYDKDAKHKSWRRTVKFARNLAKKKFDLALLLHPTGRVHLLTYLAGIPRRIGYERKLGFLLTQRIKHTKQQGEKHEREYNLDLLRCIGIEPQGRNLFMPLKADAENLVEELFRQEGFTSADKLLVIAPGASCPSKIWPAERFAQVADKLIEKYAFKTILIAGPKDMRLAEKTVNFMQHPALNLAGKTSLSQLASILKKCSLFISNDSGPVHIAVAVGLPVISIFGRNQKGLSPSRWGPLGHKDKVLHKEVGCLECLAHNCKKDFACLKAISVEDVLQAADQILTS